MQVSAGPDLYEVLGDFRDGHTDAPADFVALGLLTFGWAAPIEEGEAEPKGWPSEHPARRRVRLVAVVDGAGRVESDLHFFDTGETVTDAGAARGPLADMLVEAMTLRALADA